jgi:dienelactone hydrolase
MKLLLALAALLFISLCAVRAAEDLTVLPPAIDGVAPTGLLEAQLKKLAFAALDRREAEYEKIKTPEDVAAWQKRERAAFLAAIGGLPERTPLNARVTGQRDCGEYRMEKILFESQPGFLVSGLLYLPKGDGPHPAVLMPCGHTNIAKAGELYQRASISLARAGLAVFCYDPIGQGERRQLRKPDGTPELGPTGEHQLMGIAGTPLGTGLARTMIWDGMRALDYLQSRPEIRKDKLGCTGVSGGGTQTSYLVALDDRIAAAAPACYLTGFRRLLETLGPQDFEQNHFGQLTAGLDHADYVIQAAPRPVLIMAATRDYFDINGAWNVFRQAKRCYGRLGFPERVSLIEADTKHDLAIEFREASARWFRRWLMGSDDAWKEPGGLQPLPEKEVLCTPEGDVLRQPGARSFFDLNAAMAGPLVAERQRFWKENPLPATLAKVRELARIRPLAGIPAFNTVTAGETIQRGPVRIEKLLLRNGEGTIIPALVFRPAQVGGPTRVYVQGDGKVADAAPKGRLESLALAGETVLAVDIRGLGEMQGGKRDAGFNALAEPNWKSATLASLLGHSLVGLRTEDILACARFASEKWSPGQPVELTGIGEAGVPALHAVALEPQLFAGARIERTLQSWDNVVHSSHTKNQQVNTVHRALRYYDLPELVSATPAGKLVIHEPVDAVGAVIQKTADAAPLPSPGEIEPPGARRVVAVENVCAWPNLTLLRDGTVAAIFHNDPTHGQHESDVECWASSDGLKWEKRGVVTQHEPHTARMNHAVGLAKNGVLVVLCSGWSDVQQPGRPKQAAFRDAVLRPWVLRSSDGGRTWTKRDAFPAPDPDWSEYVPFGDIWTGADGLLHTSCYQRAEHAEPAVNRCSWHFRSEDDGWTWQRDSIIGPGHNETDIFPLGGRNWLAAARFEHAAVDLIRSDDDGVTWQSPRRVTSIGTGKGHGEVNGHLNRLQDGRVLLSYGVRTAGKQGVCAKLSSDEGRTWTPPLRLAYCTGDCGYPSSVQLASGSIVTAWYAKQSPEHDGYHMGATVWNAPPAASLRPIEPAQPEGFAHARITEAWAAYADLLTFGRGQTLALLDDGCTMSRPEWKAAIDGVPKVRVAFDAVDGDDDPKHEGKGYHGSTIGIPSSVNYGDKRGVAYNNQVAVVRGLECCHCKIGDSASLARALQWVIDHHAEHHITTVNLSPVDDLEHAEPVPTEIDTKLAELRSMGIWVSAPAGNHNFTKGISWPASQPNCFAIGAVKPGQDLVILDRHEKVDLLVPASATSSSNAMVCGAAMILREAIEKSGYEWNADGPNIADAMMAIFKQTGVVVEDPVPKRSYRRLDLMAALEHVMKKRAANPAK